MVPRLRVVTLACAALVAVLPGAALAKLRADEIAGRIDHAGAAATIGGLIAKHKWHRVLAYVGTGRPEWVALAPRLATGTDAGQSTELTIALADALPRRPAVVLGVIAGGIGPMAVARVCSAPFIEPVPADLKAYREKTRRAVEAVNAPPLREVRRACLAALRPPRG